MPNPTIEIRKLVSTNYVTNASKEFDDLSPGTYGLYDPAKQRVVDEEKIDVLHDKLLDAVRSPHTIHGMCRMAMLNDLMKEAGLEKEPQ